MAAVQRFRQGIRALMAFTQVLDDSIVRHYLSPAQMALFDQMSRAEQLHSINVLKHILAQDNHTPHDLAVAALLHDVGKIRYPLAIWQKSLGVVVRKFLPGRFTAWSQDDGSTRWKRAFVVITQHPAWGAALVAPTGANERILWLISHHADTLKDWQHHPYAALLRRLKWADDAN
jgi:hypothetical protein